MSDPNLIPIDDALLGAYLAGETDADENVAVEKWRAASPENEKQFQELSAIWNHAGETMSWPEVNTDAAWQKVKGNTIEKKSSSRNWFYFSAAASVVLLIGLAYFWFSNNAKPTEFATTNSSQTFTLADGSKVTLNKNSKLLLDADFGKEKRNVSLTGEGFFEIAPDAAHPFTVHSGALDVQVLATAFNVSAYNTDKITVSVEHGRVRCKAVSGKSEEILTKDESAEFLKSGDRVEKIDGSNKNSFAWKTHIFNFENVPLSEVSAQLSEVYDVKIVIKNEDVKNIPVRTSFKQKTLNEIFGILKDFYNINVHQEGRLYVIDR